MDSSGDEETAQPPLLGELGNASKMIDHKDSPKTSPEDMAAFITRAQKSYQTMLQATKNLDQACPVCQSKFCLNGYSTKAKPKIKAARELYGKSRQRLADAHVEGILPEKLARELPDERWC